MTRLYFNPRCGTARAVRSMLVEADVDFDVVEYLESPPSEDELRLLVRRLDGIAADLVRKDAHFARLGLEAEDYETEDAVVALLVAHPELLQRPLLVTDEAVIVGRPPSRIEAWIAAR